jgi:hypothetical protein
MYPENGVRNPTYVAEHVHAMFVQMPILPQAFSATVQGAQCASSAQTTAPCGATRCWPWLCCLCSAFGIRLKSYAGQQKASGVPLYGMSLAIP